MKFHYSSLLSISFAKLFTKSKCFISSYFKAFLLYNIINTFWVVDQSSLTIPREVKDYTCSACAAQFTVKRLCPLSLGLPLFSDWTQLNLRAVLTAGVAACLLGVTLRLSATKWSVLTQMSARAVHNAPAVGEVDQQGKSRTTWMTLIQI